MNQKSHLEQIELRSDDVQEILSKIPVWIIRWGSLVILIIICASIILSHLIKYPDIIITEALVTTQIPPEKIYAKTTGKISKILVANNDTVTENTPLAILKNTAIYKDVLLLKSITDSIKANNKYFDFPIDKIPILFLGDINPEFTNFENNYYQYILNKKLTPYKDKKNAAKTSIIELKNQMSSIKQKLYLLTNEQTIIEETVLKKERLSKENIISLQEFKQEKLKLIHVQKQIASLKLEISEIKGQTSDANKNDKLITIDKTVEEIQLFKNVIHSFNQLKIKLNEWENTYLVQSNTNGTVNFLDYWSKNQQVSKNKLMFTIIPNNKDYIVKLRTPPYNSGKIEKGQKVNIKLKNYPEYEFGILVGKVEHISLMPDEENQYHIDVSLPESLITTYNKKISFKQEMTGSAEIITKDLRLTQRIFNQLKKALDN